MKKRRTRSAGLIAVTLVAGLAMASCGSDGSSGSPSTAAPSTGASTTAASTGGSSSAPGDSSATTAAPSQGTAASEITEPVTIRFENYNLASAGPGKETTEKLLAEFKESHPLITVETTATPDQQMFQSIQAEVVAGNPPDVAQLVLREWDQIIENLPVQPLDEVVGKAAVQAHLESGHPYHPKAAALTERNGTQYGLAYVFSTPTLFFNADLMRKAGLDPDKPPSTWEEVAAAAQAIADKTDADGIYIACIELDWCTQGIIRSNGGRVMSEDRSSITWAGPEAVDVYKFWQGMVQSGAHVDLSAADAVAAFSAGKLGMILDTSARQTAYINASKDNWELHSTGMPSFGDKPPVPVNSGAGLGILTKDPVKQAAAWELIKFLTSDEAQTTITKGMGYLPLRPTLVDDPAFLGTWDRKDLIAPNLAQLDTLEPSLSFPGPNALQIRDLFLNSLEQVLFDKADPAKTFSDTQDQANDLVPS